MFNYGADYDDELDDDFCCDYKDSWFHRQYQETAYKNGVKKSVQEKLFTDKKLTFEEYTTLLEIVTENLEIVLIVIMENSTLFLENEL